MLIKNLSRPRLLISVCATSSKPQVMLMNLAENIFCIDIEESESEPEPAIEVWDEDDHELK